MKPIEVGCLIHYKTSFHDQMWIVTSITNGQYKIIIVYKGDKLCWNPTYIMKYDWENWERDRVTVTYPNGETE